LGDAPQRCTRQGPFIILNILTPGALQREGELIGIPFYSADSVRIDLPVRNMCGKYTLIINTKNSFIHISICSDNRLYFSIGTPLIFRCTDLLVNDCQMKTVITELINIAILAGLINQSYLNISCQILSSKVQTLALQEERYDGVLL